MTRDQRNRCSFVVAVLEAHSKDAALWLNDIDLESGVALEVLRRFLTERKVIPGREALAKDYTDAVLDVWQTMGAHARAARRLSQFNRDLEAMFGATDSDPQ